MVSIILSDTDRQMLSELKHELKRMNDTQIPVVLVSCSEAGRLLGVTHNTISLWIRQNKLQKRTIDGVTGILLSDLIDMRLKRREAKEPQ